MNAPRQTSIGTVEPVLIEAHSDGFVQVYGSKNVSAVFLNRPHVTTPESGRTADRLIDDVLPTFYKSVYYPGMIRATGRLEKIEPSKILQRVDAIDLLHALDPTSGRRSKSIKQRILAILGGGR